MTHSAEWPRLVGGDIALDFVNTDVVSQHDRTRDVLRSVADFLAWCASAGVPGARPTVVLSLSVQEERAFLAEAASCRTALRSVVESLAERRSGDEAALHLLRMTWAGAIAHTQPEVADSVLTWTWPPTSVRSPLWAMCAAAVDLLSGPVARRIKLCPGCGFAFLDATKNGSRRWCAMEDCGTEEKMRRFVAKRAAARTGGGEARTRPTKLEGL